MAAVELQSRSGERFAHRAGARSAGTIREAPFLHQRGSSDLIRALDRARDRDLAHVLDNQLADPDNVAGLLKELWLFHLISLVPT